MIWFTRVAHMCVVQWNHKLFVWCGHCAMHDFSNSIIQMDSCEQRTWIVDRALGASSHKSHARLNYHARATKVSHQHKWNMLKTSVSQQSTPEIMNINDVTVIYIYIQRNPLGNFVSVRVVRAGETFSCRRRCAHVCVCVRSLCVAKLKPSSNEAWANLLLY